MEYLRRWEIAEGRAGANRVGSGSAVSTQADGEEGGS